mmetsp:Transcript_76844/g.156290  ORF Transcript_76844/g.156290 Transcript_76844/m.156290 type:complete len:188 (+) Transcript_76844:210-773(+)
MYLLARAVCNVIGNLFPAYASYKAVLSKNPKAHKQWLMYWIVNTFFIVFEMFGDALVSWVPLYYEAKIVFIVWLTLPQFQGATVMYKKFIEPALENYEKDIDSGISAAGERVSHHVRQISDASATFLRTQGAAVLRKGSEFVSQGAVEAAAALARQQLQEQAAKGAADGATPRVESDTDSDGESKLD